MSYRINTGLPSNNNNDDANGDIYVGDLTMCQALLKL